MSAWHALPLAGVIHTGLTRSLLGEGLLRGVVGLVGSPWLKSPTCGLSMIACLCCCWQASSTHA